MITAALVLSGVLLQAEPLKWNERFCPYVLVTKAGERIGIRDLPKRDGKPVKFRMCANETLAAYPSADVDWGATDKANASVPTPAPVPEPTRQTVSGYAKRTTLRDADAAVRQNQSLSGKIKFGDREVSIDPSAPFFGNESVSQYLELGTFLADMTGCPGAHALVSGSVKNVSPVKLRGLKGLVVMGSTQAGDYNGQVQSLGLSDLVPGEESQVLLRLSCDWAQKAMSTYLTGNENVDVLLADVSGRAEELAGPGGARPVETTAPAGTAPRR